MDQAMSVVSKVTQGVGLWEAVAAFTLAVLLKDLITALLQARLRPAVAAVGAWIAEKLNNATKK